MSSIRSKLLVWQISALLLTGLLVSGITYLLAWDAFNRIRDFGLEQIAYSVLRHGVEYDNDSEVRNDHGQFVSQIWAADGSLVYSSAAPNSGPPLQTAGLHKLTLGDTNWHVFAVREGGLTIQVANTAANRAERFSAVAKWLLLPLIVLVTVLGLLIRAAVTRALTPLQQVRAEIAVRNVQSLHALESRNLPDEVAPLVNTLNELLGRLDASMQTQRQFIADAAHELRTPLTAIKLQSQIVRRAESTQDRQKALDALESGIERATHLIAQLLQIARLEPDAMQSAPEWVSLDGLARQAIADFSSQAETRNIDLGLTQADAVTCRGQTESLRILINNLLDNALRYCPPGARVDLSVTREGKQAVLRVIDTGSGIPAEEHERVFARFHRLASADIPGSGLGLAIVREVVQQHQGSVQLSETPGGGLTVTVTFPLAQASHNSG